MIYPPSTGSGSSGSKMRSTGARTGAHVSGTGCAKGMRSSKKTKQQQQVVQWKQRNVQEGIVIVDELQLSKLIKRDPIQAFYDLDSEPFATGQFASVSRCRSRATGQQFAAKFSSRARYGEDCSAEIYHEIALLSLCSPSSRVTRLHDVFETPTEIILVLEFAPGGDLQTIIDDNLVPFEADVVKFVRQLVEGLVYLHERKIAHLDIKPQNLVMMADFPDCDVKLCDFEISRVILEGIEIREILGTPDYVAPEILHYEPITLKADMWSLGVTTYVLLTGFSPFGGETDQQTFCNISRAEVDFPEELFEDVSEEAQDFIRCLLVRDPGARPSAKECLRHKWLSKKIPRTSTPPSLLRHDSSMLVSKTTPRAVSPSEDCTRMSARNATQQQKNLRKYLSKSREALFERVVQQQQQHQKKNLRKTTLLSQYHKTRRLCESQMSLVSKSRERLLMMDHQMSPYISRSREKLYGLRSLSKSHEVLDLCRSAAAAGGQTPQGVGLGILKTLTRATTADLSMIPLLRQRLMGHGSSTTSISSSVTTDHDMDETTVPLSPSEHVKFSRMCSVPVSAIASPITATPIEELLENLSQSPNNTTKSPIIPMPAEEEPLPETDIEHITQVPALLSPKLLKETILNQSKFEMFSNSTLPVYEANFIPHDEQTELKTPDGTTPFKTQTGVTCTWKRNETDCFDGPDFDCTSNYQDDKRGEDNNSEEERKLKYEAKGKCMCLPQEIPWTQQNTSNTSESTPEIRVENKKEQLACVKKCEDVAEEDSEPRYTVAQLISAFNRHQEVVTKTSLEVTMTTSDKETKIPPMIFNTGDSKFPTGPNALRLFIPGIDITNEPPKRKQKRKYNLGLRFPNATEQNTEAEEASKEIIESSKDTYQTEDDESFQSLESSSSLATSDYDSITNFSMPEGPIDKERNDKSEENITIETEEARTSVNFFDENVDSTNNNNHDDSSSICTLVVEPPSADEVLNTEPDDSQHNVNINKFQLAVEVTPNYVRSGSLSSDTSATSSEGSSSMSWEEVTPPCTATPTRDKNEAQQWPQKQTTCQRQKSRSRSPSVNRESWGRICTGTYNRAMEKFNSKLNKQENTVPAEPNRRPNRKSLTLLSPPEVTSAAEKARRKSIPVIKQLS